jgi:pyrroline-5-carboxylate reductase
MRIALIGCGTMGEAILAGILKKQQCFVCEPRLERQRYLKKKYRVKIGPLAEVVQVADVIVLAVKPQDFPELLAEIASRPVKGKLFISIAAGITTHFIERALKQAVRVVRVMPNLPALINEGVTGLARGKRATPKDIKVAESIFRAVGATLVVKETMMDALTAVSGSGPAYVFLFVECLIKVARKLGFDEKSARELVYPTLTGSAHMLARSKEPAGILRQKVTSKGGTTQAAMDVFRTRKITGVFEGAMKAARARAKELSQ